MPDLRIVLLVLATLFATVADAAIYKCVDSEGRVTFTDARCKGGKRVDVPTGGGVPSSGISSSASTRRVRAQTPADFPRIDSASQQRRDDIRRQILEDEIASEKRNAATARQHLTLGLRLQSGEHKTDKTYFERVSRLRDAIARHDQNIAAIQRELANLRK